MSKSQEPRRIAGYAVDLLTVGDHTLGTIAINENITVVFRMNDGGDGGTDPGGKCLACKISKIRECADTVCPDIKEHDPNASCSDAIAECAALACRESCKRSGGGLEGNILIMTRK